MRFQSALVTKARGSLGGITFTANQYQSLIMRARTIPVNPSTEHQQGIRIAFADASGAWENLSDANRDLWEDYADSVSFTGPMGDYTLPGRTMFMRNFATANYYHTRFPVDIAAVVDTPPIITGPFNISNPNTSAPAVPSTGFDLAVTSFETEDWVIFAQISRPFNSARQRYKGPYKTDTTQVSGLAGAGSITMAFAGLEAGKVYFVNGRAFVDDGPVRLSIPFNLRAVAETNP